MRWELQTNVCEWNLFAMSFFLKVNFPHLGVDRRLHRRCDLQNTMSSIGGRAMQGLGSINIREPVKTVYGLRYSACSRSTRVRPSVQARWICAGFKLHSRRWIIFGKNRFPVLNDIHLVQQLLSMSWPQLWIMKFSNALLENEPLWNLTDEISRKLCDLDAQLTVKEMWGYCTNTTSL